MIKPTELEEAKKDDQIQLAIDSIKKGEDTKKDAANDEIKKLKEKISKLEAEKKAALDQVTNFKASLKVPNITKIQAELKAPKNQYNSFGKYKYRNAEDIEQAVKPLLEKYHAQLTFDESIIAVGDRIYVEVIAKYKDTEQEIRAKGHAREALNKKGMDDSQITGAASSYATKYALAKLFLIDDTKDADSQQANNHQSQSRPRQSSQQQPVTNRFSTLQQAQAYPAEYPAGTGKRRTLLDIWNDALNGDKAAVAWWKETRHKPDTQDGSAVLSFEALKDKR